MSIKVSPLSRQNSRLQLQPAGYGFKKKKTKTKTRDRPQLSVAWVVCFLLIKSTPQHTMEETKSGMGHEAWGMWHEREICWQAPKKISQSPPEMCDDFCICRKTEIFFFCDFNLKFAQRSPGMSRNVEGGGSEFTVSAQRMQTNSASSTRWGCCKKSIAANNNTNIENNRINK